MSRSGHGFENEAALVTGGSRGIGAAIALALAEAGASVVVTGRDTDALARVVALGARSGHVIHAVGADLTQTDQTNQLRLQAEAAVGFISLIAACAGGGGEPEPLVGMSLDRWRSALDVNLTTAFLTLQAFVPPMLEAGRGSIVTLGSTAGRQLSGASAAYAAAKTALGSLTRQAAAAVAPRGIRINCVSPSSIVTDRLAAAPQTARDEAARHFPLGRLGSVDDVAAAVLFLLGEQASWITGATLDIAGGRVML